MKRNFILMGIVAISAMFLGSCANRIDAGHVGIKVNLYGSSKGVDDVTEVTGMVWYNPFTTSVYEVPTFVQNTVYTNDDVKGSRDNEEFRVTTKDGMVAAFDVSMNYLTPSDRVVAIFRKYRKPISELEKTVIRTFLREAFNNAASNYTAEQLYERRTEFEKVSEEVAVQALAREGFIVEQLVILNEIRLPQDVTQRINDKVKATQITKQKEEEVRQAKAEADKRIEESRGRAESMKIEADAERYAYQQKQSVLTPLLVQQQFIEKWDGKLPVYGQVPELFRTVTK
jgi:regulator of protease activity HflC (stomatin/prohibitin superfamily)